MTIFINQEEFSVDEALSLFAFLSIYNFVQDGLAVAVNNTVIPKSEWELVKLNDKDQLMLIRATAGG